MKYLIVIFILLNFGCTKKEDPQPPEEIGIDEVEVLTDEKLDQEKQAFLDSEKIRKEEVFKEMQLKFAAFEKKNPDYKKYFQLKQSSFVRSWPEATSFKEFVKKANEYIQKKGLVFSSLNFSQKEVKDHVFIPQMLGHPLAANKNLAILNPKGETKKPVVITNEIGVSDGPCSFSDSIFETHLKATKIKSSSLFAVDEQGKGVWLYPDSFHSVRIYKKGEKEAFLTMIQPGEENFVIDVHPTLAIVYFMLNSNWKLNHYQDYPGVKHEKDYLVLEMSSSGFKFITDPKIYKKASDYRGRIPYEENKGHVLKNKNYEFRFSLDVCT